MFPQLAESIVWKLFQNSLKSPLASAALYSIIAQKFWLKLSPSFRETGRLQVTNGNKKYQLLQTYEAAFVAIYGAALVPYIALNRESYTDFTVLHMCIYLAGSICCVGSALLSFKLQSTANEVTYFYNSLINIKENIAQLISTDRKQESHGFDDYIKRLNTFIVLALVFSLQLFYVPVFTVAIVYLNVDPTYFLFSYVARKNIIFHIFTQVLRVLFIGIVADLISVRVFGFFLIMDCCRLNAMDFVLTALSPKTGFSFSSLKSRRIYIQLQICHQQLTTYLFQHFYCFLIGFCTLGPVVCLWLSILTTGNVPIYLSFLLYASSAVGLIYACIYIGVCAGSHGVSNHVVETGRKQDWVICKSKFDLKCWKSVRFLKMHCGQYFCVTRFTVLTSLHIILNNLASLFLLYGDIGNVLEPMHS